MATVQSKSVKKATGLKQFSDVIHVLGSDGKTYSFQANYEFDAIWNGYSVVCPLINVASQGHTKAEASAMIHDAVKLFIDCVLNDKQVIPQ